MVARAIVGEGSLKLDYEYGGVVYALEVDLKDAEVGKGLIVEAGRLLAKLNDLPRPVVYEVERIGYDSQRCSRAYDPYVCDGCGVVVVDVGSCALVAADGVSSCRYEVYSDEGRYLGEYSSDGVFRCAGCLG